MTSPGGAAAVSSADPDDLRLPDGSILLHIGPPKTGTTAVQGAIHARRAAVRAQGVRYAGRTRHSGAAVNAVTGRPSFTSDTGAPPIRKWNELVADVQRAREARVLVSSEFFADAEPDRIPRIVADLGPRPLHVVVTLRPLARLLASQWQQYVQSFMRLSFDEWLDGVLNGPPGVVTPTFWRRHRHDELVERWAAVVGPRNVSVVIVDEADHDHILRVFERLLGLEPGTLVADDDVTNRSMTMAEIEAVRAFNDAFWDAGLRNALYHRVMHFGAAAYMRLRTPALDEARIETPQWALDRSREIAREMVGRIEASGVRIIGDLESLTAVPTSRLPGDRQPVACIPPAIAAAMAMGVAVAGGAARGNPRAYELVTRVGQPDIARFSSYHLAGAVGMRLGSGLLRSLERLLGGRGRSAGATSEGLASEAATAVATFSDWLRSAGIRLEVQERLRAGAVAGLRFAPADANDTATEPGGPGPPPTDDCASPRIAAGLAMGVLVASGLAREQERGGLRAARLAWAEPPELAVASSWQLIGVVIGRAWRGLVRRRRT